MSEPRTLRSKHLRAALWVAAVGKCQMCGEPLPDTWAADHVIPWKSRPRTNPHEMQALCLDCNRRKGVMSFRKHQAELARIFDGVARGTIPLPKLIVAEVVFGGGKQGLGGLFGHLAVERYGIASRLCLAVPNLALRRQAVVSLGQDKWLAKLTGHRLRIYESANDVNPSKDGNGFALTYPALAADGVGLNRRELERVPHVAVFDECNHLGIGGQWTKAAVDLAQPARCVLLTTAMLSRADRKRIAFLPYTDAGYVDRDTPRDDILWIRYSRIDGLAERAIVPLHFRHVDGRAEWLEDGVKRSAESLSESRSSIFVALHSDYADALLAACVEDWLRYRNTYAWAKCLVVCANIRQAQRILKRLHAMGLRDAEIATSAEVDPKGVIRRFTGGDDLRPGERELRIIVTVAMAYEGLDVPAITHLAGLTHIRSREWVGQMLNRSNRVYLGPGAPPYGEQAGHDFVPDDDLMNQCIREILAEQAQAAAEEQAPGPGPGGTPPPPRELPVITPLWSSITTTRASDGSVVIDSEATARYVEIAEATGLPLSPLQIRQVIEADARLRERPLVRVDGASSRRPEGAGFTPTEDLAVQKRHLNEMVKAVAQRAVAYEDNPEGWRAAKATVDVDVARRFGDREAMDLPTVLAAQAYLKEWLGS